MNPKAATKSANLYSRWSLPPSSFHPGCFDSAVAISLSPSFTGLDADVDMGSPRRNSNHGRLAVRATFWRHFSGLEKDRRACRSAQGRFVVSARSRQRVGPETQFEPEIVMENVLTPTSSLDARSPRALRPARAWLWIGRVLTGLCAAFLLFDAVGKLLMLAPYVEGTRRVGYAIGVIRPLGVVLALSTLLHLLPRTQFIGALLLTAYLGGATATHVHLGQPFW